MTAPRPVLANSNLMLTRRITQRTFLLRPDPKVVAIYNYCLAEAAARFGVPIYGWIAMSNHEHILTCDPKANYPEFIAHFRKMVAKAMNRHHKRNENFWSSEQANVVRLLEPRDCFERLIYILMNPVAADLVDRAADWPGASSLVQNLSGRPLTVRRPPGYFRDDGPMPEEVTLKVTRIPGYETLTDEEWREKILDEVRRAEERVRAERLKEHRGLLGRKGVLETDPQSRPGKEAQRSRVRPHLAARDPARRMEALRAIRSFRDAHRRAREKFRAGDRDAVFPNGTYQMRRLGARCVEDVLPPQTAPPLAAAG